MTLDDSSRRRCFAALIHLAQFGHELRRPQAENLGDGIYELRVKVLKVNYRMLYFFHGQRVVVLSHGFAKMQAIVPNIEIDRALRRKSDYQANPARHTIAWEN